MGVVVLRGGDKLIALDIDPNGNVERLTASELLARKNGRKAMKFRLEVDLDNAAFDHEDRNGEIALMLRECADMVEHGGAAFRLFREINGNRIGQFALIADEDEGSEAA